MSTCPLPVHPFTQGPPPAHTATRAARVGWRTTALMAASMLLVACGGGDDQTGSSTATTASGECPAFTDSFGRTLTCDDMRQLPGATWGFVAANGNAGTGAGDAAADGTVADAGPVAGTVVEFRDTTGRAVRATTDASGYYRISLRGLTPPLLATVVRSSGNAWKSMLITEVTRAPASRKFHTVNLTGLTDALVSQVAQKAGVASADALQPAHLAAQQASVPALVTALNTTLSQPLALAGVNASTFNPLTLPFRADGKSGYDRVLRSISVTRSGGTSVLSLVGAAQAKGCEIATFTGDPKADGGQVTMNMTSDGGFCSLYLSADSLGTVPAENGQLLSAVPAKGSVVFDQINRMAYTPLYGVSGSDAFAYAMSATVNGQPVRLVVNMTVNITAP